MNKAIIEIQNLKCGGCEAFIVNGLSKVSGIDSIEVVQHDATVRFTYETMEDLEEARTKLRSMGYPPLNEKNSLGSKAQSYVSCFIGKTK